jgi:hypothetical protein
VTKSNLIYLTLSLIFLMLTNEYVGINKSFDSFSDQSYYFRILQSSPEFPGENIGSNQGQRFTIIYLIGVLLNFFNLKAYWYSIFIILNLSVITLSIYMFVKLIGNFEKKINQNFKFILCLIILFNPYFFRVSIYAPLMINDYIFVLGILLLMYSIHSDKNFLTYFSILLCSLSRQTSMILVPVLFFLYIYEGLIYKKFNQIKYLISILLITLIFLITHKISSSFSFDSNYSNYILGIFYSDFNFKDNLLMFIRIFFSNYIVFIFLIWLILYFKSENLFNKIKNNKLSIISLIVSLGIWSQPILAGPSFTLGNEARLTIMALPIFLIFFTSLFNNGLSLDKYEMKVVYFLLLISSLHHKYSILNIFEFRNFVLPVLTLPIICFLFYLVIIKKKLT